MIIDTETFKVSENNFYNEVFKKTQIIIGGSNRINNLHIIRLQNKLMGQSKSWNTYTISRSGDVYQHYDPKYYSDFMNMKSVDKQSISIILENSGALTKRVFRFYNLLNEECEENICERKWNNYLYWEQFTDEQIYSTANLCKKLCNDFNIELETIGFTLFHKNASEFNGIAFRSNFSKEFIDPNPSFDIEKFTCLLSENEN